MTNDFKPKDAYTNWIDSYPWELFLTIRLPPNIPLTKCNKHIFDLLRQVGLTQKQRIIAYIVSVPRPDSDTDQQHAHVLLMGLKHNLAPIYDLSRYELLLTTQQIKSKLNTHEKAFLYTDRNENTCNYWADHALRDGAVIDAYRPDLLKYKEI